MSTENGVKTSGNQVLIQHASGKIIFDADGVETASGVDLAITDGDLELEAGTAAAAGSAIGDATPLTTQVTTVTGGDDTKGVQIHDGNIGCFRVVHNSAAANTLEIYPPASGTINGGSANAAVTAAAKETAILFKVAANTWVGLAGVTF